MKVPTRPLFQAVMSGTGGGGDSIEVIHFESRTWIGEVGEEPRPIPHKSHIKPDRSERPVSLSGKVGGGPGPGGEGGDGRRPPRSLGALDRARPIWNRWADPDRPRRGRSGSGVDCPTLGRRPILVPNSVTLMD